MKTTTIVLTAAFAAMGCNGEAGSTESPINGFATAQQPVTAAAAPTLFTPEPIKAQFSLTADARALVPAGTIARRAPGARFTTGSVARITFASKEDGSFMRAAAERLLASPTLAAADMHSLKLKTDEGLLLLPVQGGATAYSVPESGTFTLRRPFSAERATVLQSTEEAVNAALAGIAKHGLLHLGPNESLDVLGVSAAFHNTTGDTGPVGAGERVGYQVLLGRLYRGTQVLGPPSLVVLDADGEIATFRKGWRDIASESGAMDIAPETTIDTRRDQLMVRFLALKEATCGYTEDPDPGATQGGAGAGCHYVYKNPDSREALNREVDDWVNASQDPSIPMLGARKTPAATP